MAKPKAATPATVAQWHETFRNSLFYWTGLLEDRYNQLFVQAMRPQRVTVSRYRTLAILMELTDLTINELARHSSIERSAQPATDRQCAGCGVSKPRTRSTAPLLPRVATSQ